MSNPIDLSGFVRLPPPTDLADDPVLPPPDYNSFAALGLDPTSGNAITADDVRKAKRRAARHRHEAALLRFPATATAFPSMGQVNAAHDYLLDHVDNIRSATRAWRNQHRNVFFPEYEPGDPRIFQPAPATPSPSGFGSAGPSATPGSGASATPRSGASATARSSRPARPASPSGDWTTHPDGCRCYTCSMSCAANGRSAASGPHPFRCQCYQCTLAGNSGGSARPSGGPRPSARPAASATAGSGFSPATGTNKPIKLSSGSSDNEDDKPINIDSDKESYDDSDEEEEENEPLPTLSRDRRPSGRNTSSGSRGARSSGSGTQRSSRARHTPIANPITNDRIIVGTWRNATGNPPNAVTAGFDRRGRVFYRITNRDLAGNSVLAPNATATNFQDINLRGPYRNMDAAQLRLAVDRHLRLPANQRP